MRKVTHEHNRRFCQIELRRHRRRTNNKNHRGGTEHPIEIPQRYFLLPPESYSSIIFYPLSGLSHAVVAVHIPIQVPAASNGFMSVDVIGDEATRIIIEEALSTHPRDDGAWSCHLNHNPFSVRSESCRLLSQFLS